MTRRKTNEEWAKEVKSMVGNEYTFLDPYINNKTKLHVRHNKCGYVYSVVPDSFLRGRRCPKCSKIISIKKRSKTNEEWVSQVKSLVGNEYTFLESYVSAGTPIAVRHNVCKHTMKMRPDNFLHGARCRYCAHNVKLTTHDFMKKLRDIYGNEYTVLGNYVNSDTKIKVKHNACGTVYDVRPANILRGQRCPHCFRTPKKSTAEFQKDLDAKFGKGVYRVLGTYKSAKKPIAIKHLLCNHICQVKPNAILTGKSGCPFCNTSKGEELIIGILKSENIKYQYPKIFKELKGIRNSLHYDFYIPSQNVLIEYQGGQHYKSVQYFGGEKQFKVQQKHDQLKRDYARKNGYNLIEVPYTIRKREDIKDYLIKKGLELK